MPSELLAAELVRLPADFTFLRRAFTADIAGRDPFVEVPRMLAAVEALRTAGPEVAAAHRAAFVAHVTPGQMDLVTRVLEAGGSVFRRREQAPTFAAQMRRARRSR